MSLCMVVIAAGVITTAVKWPFKTALFPMIIGISAFLMTLAELLLSLFQREKRDRQQGAVDFKFSEDVDKSLVLRRTLLAFMWIIALFLLILFFGFPIAVPTFVFLYLKLYGKEKWAISIIMTGALWFFFWGLFVWLLHTPLQEGLIIEVLKAIVTG